MEDAVYLVRYRDVWKSEVKQSCLQYCYFSLKGSTDHFLSGTKQLSSLLLLRLLHGLALDQG